MRTPHARPLLLTVALLGACSTPEPAESAAAVAPREDDRMDWWREARFGLFIHWGLYAIPAGAWNGETNHAEWIRTTAEIPVGEYERLLPQFDPVKFDADAWARMAKDAGMRYVVITSKHHDGFGLWDSAHTDWDVGSTPFKRDILQELAAACAKHGLRMCWYHSIMDWHHPDYLPRRDWEVRERPEGAADMERYVRYLHAQVTELLTRYGPIGVMWFDGEWESTWNHERGQALYDLCRSLQPEVIVNNRVDVGREGMAGLNRSGTFAGDFGTPEQEVPATGLPGVDWESCITMNRNWGFNAADRDWKSSRELIRMLCDVASKGGNLLLNVGPRADGTFPPEAVERLADIGEWMRFHGEAIYDTQASPIGAPSWGRITMKRIGDDTRLYLLVFDQQPKDGNLVVRGIGNEPLEARAIHTGAHARNGVRETSEVTVARSGDDLVVSLEEFGRTDVNVYELDLVGAPIPYLPPRIEATSDLFLDHLGVHVAPGTPELEARFEVGGAEPTASSPSAAGREIVLTETAVVRARSFHKGRGVGPIAERSFTRATPRAAVDAKVVPGLAWHEYVGTWDRLPGFDELTPSRSGTSDALALAHDRVRENSALLFQGYLRVPADGVYELELTSDDGSRLWLGDDLAIDHDGLHGASSKRAQLALAAGLHSLRVAWFNKTGGAHLALRWGRVGEELVTVPASSLAH